MDKLDQRLFEAAEQATKDLPLGGLLCAILQEGQGKNGAARPEPRRTAKPGRRALLLSAVLLLTLFAVPAFADMRIVVIDGVTRIAVDGKVTIDGVVHALSAPREEATLQWESDTRQYVSLPEQTEAAPPTPVVQRTPLPSPSSTPAPTAGFTVSGIAAVRVYVNEPTVLFDGPDMTYAPAGELKAGEQAEKTGITNNGWARLTWNDRIVYVPDAAITYAPIYPVAYPAVERRVTALAEVREKAHDGPDSEVLGVLEAGTLVKSTGSMGEWSLIVYKERKGYVLSALLTEEAVGKDRREDGFLVVGGVSLSLGFPEDGPGWDATETEPIMLYALADIPLYAGPGEGFHQVGGLYPGERIKKVGTAGEWTILLYEERLVYARKEWFKVAPLGGAQYPAKKKLAAVDAQIWKKPRTDYPEEFLGTLKAGALVEATGSIGQWAEIVIDGKKGYVLQESLINPWEEPTPTAGEGMEEGANEE